MLRQTVRGNFIYEPDGEVLTEYFWDRGEVAIIQGPIQSGTSTASLQRIWALACEQAPDFDKVRRTRWIVLRSTYKELRETTIKTWLDWFPESEWGPMMRSEPALHHLRRRHPSGDGTFVDCEVIFLAIADADVAEQTLASFEITGGFINEAQFVEKQVIDELLSRCARYPSMKNGPGATWHGVFCDLNAPVEGHWIPYMRGDIPIPKEMGEEARQFEKPEGWNFYVQPPGLIKTIKDGKVVYQPNPKAENQSNTRKSYMEIIQGKSTEWIARRVLNVVGLYVHGKPVYPTFIESEHVSQGPIKALPNWPVIVGLDFGRSPAAAFMQCVNDAWVILSELIGDGESAERFAPRVKLHLAQNYPGQNVEFWGDPRGADKGQNVEKTAYDVYRAHGMLVRPATTDNNVEMRRSTVESVLGRRNGLLIDPRCRVTKTGFAGGYHYPKIKGVAGLFSERPQKNIYSHIVEAVENALMGGGEGRAVKLPSSRPRLTPSVPHRHKVSLRRATR